MARYHHGDLRRAAIEAAILEVEEHGHAAFTVDRVAKRVGVTAPAIYRHHAGRDALLREVIWDGFVRFAARIDAAVLAADTDEGVLLGLGQAYVRFALENPGWFRLQFSQVGLAEPAAIRHEEVGMKYPEIAFAALRRLLGDDEDVTGRAWLLLWSTAHGVASLCVERVWSNFPSDEARLVVADQLIADAVRGIVRPR